MSFYVELSSNALFPENTIANFRNRVQLLHPLKGYWEVGMSEISYSKTWKNVFEDCYLSIERMYSKANQFTPITTVLDYSPINGRKRKGIVRSGFYDSVQLLINEITIEMLAFKKYQESLPQLFYDQLTRNVYIKPGKHKGSGSTLPFLNPDITGILGFDHYSISNPRLNTDYFYVSDRPADINAGITSLYVYCNIVLPQYIGDTRAKLLRTVEIPNDSKFGDQVVIKYENPHYIPIINFDFENIEIDIKDDTDTPIQFMSGRTRIKLHFRECQTHT